MNLQSPSSKFSTERAPLSNNGHQENGSLSNGATMGLDEKSTVGHSELKYSSNYKHANMSEVDPRRIAKSIELTRDIATIQS